MFRKGLLLVSVTAATFLALSCCCCCGGDSTEMWENLFTESEEEEDESTDWEWDESTEPEEETTVNSESFVHLDQSDAKTATVMVYMNGTDLEQDGAGAATEDLKEMLSADLGDNVNVVIETLGTTDWTMSGISGDTAQRFLIQNGKLVCIEDNLGKVDVTEASSLSEFITYAAGNYPADRYFLILWNHGGGPVYGYGVNGWDSDSDDSLMLDEIKTAVSSAGVYFDAIGFDACLMGSLEVAYALKDNCEYLVASEDFEPGTGWEYKQWLTTLSDQPGINMEDLGRVIVDDYVTESDEAQDKGIEAVIRTAYIDQLWAAWLTYAYENKDTLIETNVTMDLDATSRAMPMKGDYWDDGYGYGSSYDDYGYDEDSSDVTMEEYSIVDLLAVASVVDGDSADTLKTALESTIAYAAATTDDESLCGLSVSLPYGDDYTYQQMENIFPNAGMDSTYLAFLEAFAENGSSSSSYDWSDWNGWGDDYDWDDESDEDYWDDYWNDYDYEDYDYEGLMDDLDQWLNDYNIEDYNGDYSGEDLFDYLFNDYY